MTSASGTVRDNRAEEEFELIVAGAKGEWRAVAAYQREEGPDGERIVFTHTHVPAAIEGQGVGAKLVRAALDSVRDQGLRVVPQCSFVRAWIDRHPEYRDLLA